MIEQIYDSETISWSKSFCNRWLDSKQCIHVSELSNRKWVSLPIADVMNLMGAEWLETSLANEKLRDFIGIAAGYNEEPLPFKIPASRDSILQFQGETCAVTSLMTNVQESFLVYKDHANRYHLICGPDEFVRSTFMVSYKTAKDIFFEEWANDSNFNEAEIHYFHRIWDQYTWWM
ncbi:hypothetical protein [Calycomorphotria hydatis]|uniref:Uncharacterized protein n=1 Tax=Calycomorphotria hydatis TaxID=2528027 RepID=A0A517TA55_9PLAN|nr:hypothetical protein [Calycomorphotria hydatis]QDT65249.1 hypothetical protein V22_24960 [Calycomorphotria hydatis]